MGLPATIDVHVHDDVMTPWGKHMAEPAILATQPHHYDRLGITETIQPFEDGLRTNPGEKGSYEWWYFDARLDNGAKLVVAFFTKDHTAPNGGLAPRIALDLYLPDGRAINKIVDFDPAEFTASTAGCDVQIAGNRFVGDLHTYRVTVTLDEVSVDVTLTGQTQPWRPATGHTFYGQQEQKTFAWLPSVPSGQVTVTYAVDGEATTVDGQGYHDHNWGNVSLLSVLNNWYWGRGSAGPYTFITAHMVAEKKYGYTELPVFMLAKDGKVIFDDASQVTFSKTDIHTDGPSGKPVADVHSYTYRDGDTEYVIEYRREATILRDLYIETLSGLKNLVARLIGFDACYLRFTGTVTLTHKEHGKVVEEIAEPAIWELMYFGKHAHETPQ